MLSLSPDQYVDILSQANIAFWPSHLIIIAFASFCTVLVVKASDWAGNLLANIVAVVWTLSGWMFFIGAGSDVSVLSVGYGLVCLAQAALFLWLGAVLKGLRVEAGLGVRGVVGLALMAYTTFAQIPIAFAAGADWPAASVLGVAPGATAIFTVGALLVTADRPPALLTVVPTALVFASGIAAVSSGTVEDLMALPAGVVAVYFLLPLNHAHRRQDYARKG